MFNLALLVIFQANSNGEWANFFGHFHPLLVHFPIGILLIGMVLDFVNTKRQNDGLTSAVHIVYFWGAMSAILSCWAGYYLSQTGGYDEDTLKWHQLFGYIVAGVSTVLYLFKKMATVSWLQFMNKINNPLLFLLTILLLVTGHLGGNMTHGSDYLTASLPQPYKGWLGIESKFTPKAHVIKDTANAIAYVDVIQPILEAKCYQCHSAEKQKGKLRMDSPTYLTKGGEGGPIYLAGNAVGSELIKRVLLPENNDDHMPPKGKPQLTENEIALLHWWIQNGANFEKKVKELPQDEKVKPALAVLMAGAGLVGVNSVKVPESPVYSLKVDKASDADIKSLTDKNVLILPLSKEVNLLEASCINNKEINDTDVKLLEKLSKQLVWLKLSNTKITDAALVSIGKLENLVKLHVNHTAITDKGIDNLISLKNLEYLNLFDTQITDAGLLKLAKMKSLKKVFLWQTKVTKSGVENLKKAIPGLDVDMGWEAPVVNADSTKQTGKEVKEVK